MVVESMAREKAAVTTEFRVTSIVPFAGDWVRVGAVGVPTVVTTGSTK